MTSWLWCICPQAAAQCYIDLIVKESDNNVKLIVLDRLTSLRTVRAHEKVLQVRHVVGCLWLPIFLVYGRGWLPMVTYLQDLLMDILRVLSSPALEVRKKTLALVLDLVNSRNVEEVGIIIPML